MRKINVRRKMFKVFDFSIMHSCAQSTTTIYMCRYVGIVGDKIGFYPGSVSRGKMIDVFDLNCLCVWSKSLYRWVSRCIQNIGFYRLTHFVGGEGGLHSKSRDVFDLNLPNKRVTPAGLQVQTKNWFYPVAYSE